MDSRRSTHLLSATGTALRSLLVNYVARRFTCLPKKLEFGTFSGAARTPLADPANAAQHGPEEPQLATSVTGYASQWLELRRRRGIRTVRDDETRLRLHVLPTLGERPLSAVRPRDIRELVDRLITDGRLASGSIRNVYSTLRVLFRDAILDELVSANPCLLPRGVLRGASARDLASTRARRPSVFDDSEVRALLEDGRIPKDRRAFYALLFFTGMRHGEAAGRRWRDVVPDARPLGALALATQYDNQPLKTNATRVVPIHPALERALSEWRVFGFEEFFGRAPTPEDFIVPSRRETCRKRGTTLRNLKRDCARLGITARRTHDTRHTFISRARRAGARKDIIQRITHNATGDIVDQYTHVDWEPLCEAVCCFSIQ